MRLSQAVEIFGNISTALTVRYLGLPFDIHQKIYGDLPREPLPSGELYTTGVAKYSDFELNEGYILETVQDGR